MQCLGGSLDIDFSKNLVEFASDALHIVIFENFVKSIPDDPTATIMYSKKAAKNTARKLVSAMHNILCMIRS